MAYPQYQRQPFGAKDYTTLSMLANSMDEASQNQLRNEMAQLTKNQELQEKTYTRDTLSSLASVMSKPDLAPDDAKRALSKATIDLLSYGGKETGSAAQALSKLDPFSQEEVLLGSEPITGPGGALTRNYKFGHKGPGGKDVVTKLQPVTIRPGLSMTDRLALIDAQNKGKLDVEEARGKNQEHIRQAVWQFNLGNKSKSDLEQEFKQIQSSRGGIRKELQQLKGNLIPLPSDADKDSYIYQRWLEGENMRERANAIAGHLQQQPLAAEPPPFDAETMQKMEQKYGGVQGTKFRTPDYEPANTETFDDLFNK